MVLFGTTMEKEGVGDEIGRCRVSCSSLTYDYECMSLHICGEIEIVHLR